MNVADLGSADLKKYLLRIAGPHSIETAFALEDADTDEEIVSFDGGRGGDRDVTVLDASVVVDADTPVGRTLSLQVADPGKLLTVAQDANYIDRQLHAKVGVPVPDIGKTIWRTQFQGPIVLAPRSGDVVQFTAHGQGRYGMHGIKEITIYPKGMPVTAVIKRILIDLCGETPARLGGIPDLAGPKLQEALILHIQAQPFVQAQKLAAGLSRHLHYACIDSSGMRPVMTRVDSTHVDYEFTSAFDQPGMVSSPPEWSTDVLGDLKNAVRIIGGATKTTKAPYGYAYATGDFSPGKLGRRDSEAYIWDLQTIATLHTQEAVDRVAANILARDLVFNRQLKFESMPMYLFDEYDLVAIQTSELIAQLRLRQFTIPLNIDGAPTMSYGWTARRSSDAFAGRR